MQLTHRYHVILPTGLVLVPPLRVTYNITYILVTPHPQLLYTMALSSGLRTVLNRPHPRQLLAGSSFISPSLGSNVVTKRTYIKRQDMGLERPVDAFLSAVQTRRSIYGLTNESTISDERIVQLVEHSSASRSFVVFYALFLIWLRDHDHGWPSIAHTNCV